MYGMPATEPEIEVFVPCPCCQGGGDGNGANGNGAAKHSVRCSTCGGDGEVIERVPLRLLPTLAGRG
jgi:DnaJ-class molecular chaperone